MSMRFWLGLLGALWLAGEGWAAKVFHAADYGIVPGAANYTASDVARLLDDVRQACAQQQDSKAEPIRLLFAPGTYEIGLPQCQTRTWFISNHDQDNPKRVFLPLEGLTQVEFCGNGAFFNLHARIIPFGIWDSQGVALKDFTVDYACPPLSQITFTAVDPKAQTVTFRPLPELKPELEGTRLSFRNPEFSHSPRGGILFEPDGTIAYRTGDLGFNLDFVTANPDGTFTAAGCAHEAFHKGQSMALRGWGRPAPGIVVSDSKEVSLQAITLHYTDGMGILAQSSDDIELKGIRILPNAAKGRFFSTQADATHFSGCGGEIFSTGGRYIGMMDDAINVHGTYLRIQKRVNERTLEAAYMHGQSYGFTWGIRGDEVTFIRSQTMERLAESDNTLEAIEPLDKPETRAGAKRFRLIFAKPLPPEVDPDKGALGIENLTRTPSVFFSLNYVGKNRARGALFSTPKPVMCSANTFDHTSGSAILLCGDCNGWYETGACTRVHIVGNHFVNALTSPYQFTEAVISICPEIPDLDHQQAYFHRNVTIEQNTFVAFDYPLVFAKSVDGLYIRRNTLEKSAAFAPYHWNREWLTLRRCTNVQAEEPKTIEQP
ncbi:MAG: alpha-1,3-galactosidase B [Candidatus Spyradenecus sp.]